MFTVLLVMTGCGAAEAEVQSMPPATQFVTGWARDFCAGNDSCTVEWKGDRLLVWGRNDTRSGMVSYTYFAIDQRSDGLGEVPYAYRTGRNKQPLAAWAMEPAVRTFLDRAQELDCGMKGSCSLKYAEGELVLAPIDLLVDSAQ